MTCGRKLGPLLTDESLLEGLLQGLDYAAQLHGFALYSCAECHMSASSLWYLVRTRKRSHYKTMCWRCMVSLKRKWIEKKAEQLTLKTDQ